MIREIVYNTIGPPPILLREEYDEKSRKRNKILTIKHALEYAPSVAREVAYKLRIKNTEYKWCKLILMRERCIDVFDIVQPYLYVKDVFDFDFNFNCPYFEPLPERKFLRIVSKLIRMECVVDIPRALELATFHDNMINKFIEENPMGWLYIWLKTHSFEEILYNEFAPLCINIDNDIIMQWL